MTIHIQKFVDRVRGLEARGAKELIISIQEAKDLHSDITKLLLALQNLQEFKANAAQEQQIEVRIQGGSFK